jgi:hypothetical protein
MPRSRNRAECPSCGNGILERRRRKFWMRLVPGSKCYVCDWCLARYLTVYGRPIRLSPQDT